MNEFELKTFIIKCKELSILNAFEVCYKKNPQFNDLLVFWKQNGFVFSFFAPFDKYREIDFDKKTDILFKKIKLEQDNIHNLIFNHVRLDNFTRRDYLKTSMINYLISLNDIGAYDFDEHEFRSKIIHFSDNWDQEQPIALDSYCKLLELFGIDNIDIVESNILDIKPKKLLL